MAGIWNKIIKAMANPKVAALKPVQTPTQKPAMAAYAVQSWNKETHPEGMGRSHLVQDIDYNGDKLDVTYNDGFTAEYDNITPDEVKQFIQSDSKGRWALKHLWNKPYRKA